MFGKQLASRPRIAVLLALFVVGLYLASTAGLPLAYAADTDNDGFSDANEMAYGTDRLSADTDGDTLSDGDEIYIYGTNPLMPDTDGDGTRDDVDLDPLDDGMQTGGLAPVTRTFSRNLPAAAYVGTTPHVLKDVNAISGEFRPTLLAIDLVSAYAERSEIVLRYGSGSMYDGIFGDNVYWNFGHQVSEDGSTQDITVRLWDEEVQCTYSGGTWTVPGGYPFAVSRNTSQNEIYVTFKDGRKLTFNRAVGYLKKANDRFGNATTLTRNYDGQVTKVTFPDGQKISLTYYDTGRVKTLDDAADRTWTLMYNLYDNLAGITNPLGDTCRFVYQNGWSDSSLDDNLVRIEDECGNTRLKVEYDTSDRVTKQTILTQDATLSYSFGTTTVTDFAGNQVDWNYAAGAVIPTDKVVYTNRNVRTNDPDSFTTSYEFNSKNLLTKVVFPRGNRLDLTWDSHYCLTRQQLRATDTDIEDEDDLVWSNTYGSTYHQLKNSTGPDGETVTRTLDSLELVTKVSYPAIERLGSDGIIEESMTWNSQGQMLTKTDGEGVVTKFEYFATGEKKGLLDTRTVDYGEANLNLKTVLDYNSRRHLVSETDPDENVWTYGVNLIGLRTSSTSPSPMNYETKYTYLKNGLPKAEFVENVDKTNTRSTSHPWWTKSFTYNAAGWVTSQKEEISANSTRKTQFAYDGNGQRTLTTHPRGNKTLMVYDERGYLAKKTRGYLSTDASTELFNVDENGNATEYVNALGKSTKSTFDKFGRVTKVETSLGHYLEYTLNQRGKTEEIKAYDSADTLLACTRLKYDELGRLWKYSRWIDDEDGTVEPGEWLDSEFSHDKRGLIVGATDPSGDEITKSWDNARRQTEMEDDLGNRVRYYYLGDWKVPYRVDQIEVTPAGALDTFKTLIQTDALHRITETQVFERGSTTDKHLGKRKYSSLGVVVEEEDAEGNKTYFTHDGLGRVVTKEIDLGDGESIVQEFTFDANDNLVVLTDDDENETTCRFNNRDELVEIEYEDGAKRRYTLADNGQVSGWVDENGSVVANSFDDDGRLVSRSITPAAGVLGPTAEAYRWDGLSRLTMAKNNNSTVLRTWDTLSRLASETQGPNPIGQSGKMIQYAYNADGTRSKTTYPSGFELNFTTDAAKRCTGVEDAAQNSIVSTTFYGAGHRKGTVSFENGTTNEISYTGYREVETVDSKSQGVEFAGFDYAYNEGGEMLYEARSHDGGKGDLYQYDDAGRLTASLVGESNPSQNYNADWSTLGAYHERVDYILDDVSRRSSLVKTPPGGQSNSTGYITNSVKLYSSIGGTSHTYDSNGNLTSDGTYDYIYDYRNQLLFVRQGGLDIVSSEYDALGRRTEKATNGGQTVEKFHYDGEKLAEWFDGQGNFAGRGGGGCTCGDSDDDGEDGEDDEPADGPDFADIKDSNDIDKDGNTTEVNRYYFHTDGTGRITHVTNIMAVVVESYVYSPTGEVTILNADGEEVEGYSPINNQWIGSGRTYDPEIDIFYTDHGAFDAGHGRMLQSRGYACGLDGGVCFNEACEEKGPIVMIDPMAEVWEEFGRRLREGEQWLNELKCEMLGHIWETQTKGWEVTDTYSWYVDFQYDLGIEQASVTTYKKYSESKSRIFNLGIEAELGFGGSAMGVVGKLVAMLEWFLSWEERSEEGTISETTSTVSYNFILSVRFTMAIDTIHVWWNQKCKRCGKERRKPGSDAWGSSSPYLAEMTADLEMIRSFMQTQNGKSQLDRLNEALLGAWGGGWNPVCEDGAEYGTTTEGVARLISDLLNSLK